MWRFPITLMVLGPLLAMAAPIMQAHPLVERADFEYFIVGTCPQGETLQWYEDAGATVSCGDVFPTNPHDYAVIHFQSYEAATPSVAPTLRAYVEDGGNLLMEGGTVYYICDYNIGNCLNWWGSNVQYSNIFNESINVRIQSPCGSELAAGSTVGVIGNGGAAITNVDDTQATVIVTSNDRIPSMVLSQTSGGRVGFFGGFGPDERDTDEHQENLHDLVVHCLVWLAGHSTTGVYPEPQPSPDPEPQSVPEPSSNPEPQPKPETESSHQDNENQPESEGILKYIISRGEEIFIGVIIVVFGGAILHKWKKN